MTERSSSPGLSPHPELANCIGLCHLFELCQAVAQIGSIWLLQGAGPCDSIGLMSTDSPVYITNLCRYEPFGFALPHDQICTEEHCYCAIRQVPLPGGKFGQICDPGFVLVLAGQTSEPLPSTVAALGPVARRCKDGKARVDPAGGLISVKRG